MNIGRQCSLSGCGMTRRKFLGGCAVCAAGSLLTLPSTMAKVVDDNKMRIRIVYSLHGPQQTGPDWPNKGFDFRPIMHKTQKELTQQYPGFEFVSSLATGPEQAKEILEQDKSAQIDGYLVPDELLEPGCADDRDIRQAGAVRRFPVWRKRGISGLHCGISPQQSAECWIRGIFANRGYG